MRPAGLSSARRLLWAPAQKQRDEQRGQQHRQCDADGEQAGAARLFRTQQARTVARVQLAGGSIAPIRTRTAACSATGRVGVLTLRSPLAGVAGARPATAAGRLDPLPEWDVRSGLLVARAGPDCATLHQRYRVLLTAWATRVVVHSRINCLCREREGQSASERHRGGYASTWAQSCLRSADDPRLGECA